MKHPMPTADAPSGQLDSPALASPPPFPVGRELDALIAVRLFGWRWHRHVKEPRAILVPPDEYEYWLPCEEAGFPRWETLWDHRLPRYSTDIATAWQVVQHVASLGPEVALRYSQAVLSAAVKRLAPTGDVAGWSPVALWLLASPEDLCRAALEVL